jgi:hypothetical protein
LRKLVKTAPKSKVKSQLTPQFSAFFISGKSQMRVHYPMFAPSQPLHHVLSRRAGWLLILLVFLAHGGLAVLRHSTQPVWDEGRYLECALHLLGKPIDSFDDSDFVNGPGYPLMLVPFVALIPELQQVINEERDLASATPLLLARILNAFLMAGAALFVWLTLRHYAGHGWALAGAAWVGLHPSLLWLSFALMTEPLTTFCLTGFGWAFCHALRSPTRPLRWLLTAAFCLGWLTLTRVFFGHVIVATAVLSLAAYPLVRPWRPALRRTLVILAGALLICAPYLHHTWKKTGHFPTWSTNSGELLYWITSHYPGENGHWFSYEEAQTHPDLAPNHAAFFREALAKPVAEREALFKERAKQNLQANPKAFFYNWLCNLSRLAFGFPRSFQSEELRNNTILFLNGPVIVAGLLGGLIGLRFWRRVPVELWLLAAMSALYLGGTSLAPSLPRYFVVVAPWLIIASGSVLHRHLRITLQPSPGEPV